MTAWEQEPLDYPWGVHHRACNCDACLDRLRTQLSRLRSDNQRERDTKRKPPRAVTPEGKPSDTAPSTPIRRVSHARGELGDSENTRTRSPEKQANMPNTSENKRVSL